MIYHKGFFLSDEWESDNDDDEGEWVDVYHSSDEEEEVNSMHFIEFLHK